MIHISSRNSWAKTFLPVAQCGPTAKDFLMRLSSPSKGKETWHEENIYGAVMGSLSQLVGLTSVQFICCLQFIHHPQMFQQLFFVEKVDAKDNPFHAPQPRWITKNSWVGSTSQIRCWNHSLLWGNHAKHGKTCLLNLFIMMRKAKPACKQEFPRFRVNIARQLIAGKSFHARIGRRISQPLSEVGALRLNGQFHPLEFTDSRLDCVVCAKVVQAQGLHRNERSKSGVKCTVCNVALCVNKQRSCWNMWHTRVEYWLNA